MTQINSNAAASILGINGPQVSTLIRQGHLKRTNADGDKHRFIQVSYEQVLKLKEKYPTGAAVNDLIGSISRGKTGQKYQNGGREAYDRLQTAAYMSHEHHAAIMKLEQETHQQIAALSELVRKIANKLGVE